MKVVSLYNMIAPGHTDQAMHKRQVSLVYSGERSAHTTMVTAYIQDKSTRERSAAYTRGPPIQNGCPISAQISNYIKRRIKIYIVLYKRQVSL